jgi:hypothetical protein
VPGETVTSIDAFHIFAGSSRKFWLLELEQVGNYREGVGIGLSQLSLQSSATHIFQ